MLKLRLQIALILLIITGGTRCDLVPALIPGMQLPLEYFPRSVNWCTCRFLAAGGNDFDNNGIIGVYQFDQTTGNLSPIGTTTTLGQQVRSVAWCSSCKFLAAGGVTADNHGIINIYSFDSSGGLDAVVGSTIMPGAISDVFSIDWCPSCTVFAVSFVGLTPLTQALQAFGFDPDNPGNPFPIGAPVTNVPVTTIKWCGDCQYLAGAGLNITVYTLDLVMGLKPVAFIQKFFSTFYRSVDWCGTCSFIAAGGQRDSLGVVDIYRFDPLSSSSLTYVTTATVSQISDVSVSSVSWCQGCDNLAIAASDLFTLENPVLQLYHFDAVSGTLILQPSPTIDYIPLSGPRWCDNCCELAVGGANPQSAFIQLYRGNTCFIPPTPPAAPTNLRAQQTSHRFPTQVDILNTICWDAVAGPVAYKIYADAALTILLATMPSPTLCYSQHQICKCKTVTYYVTAVDANGNQSSPAVVTA